MRNISNAVIKNKVAVVTSGASYTVDPLDDVVIVNKETGSATTVTLPASPTVGEVVTVKDGKGDAATNNITVGGNGKDIDAAATYVISVNYGAITLVYNGTTSRWDSASLSPVTNAMIPANAAIDWGKVSKTGAALSDIDPDLTNFPAQSGNAGKYLTTSGSALSWGAINIPATTIDVLIVAGGGGGASGGNNGGGGGGGGGGVIITEIPVAANDTFAVSIGGGGAAETNGTNTTFGSFTAVGGGRATSSAPYQGQTGGSGGGGKGMNASPYISLGGTGTPGQGTEGAVGSLLLSTPAAPAIQFGGGGGGGAAAAGSGTVGGAGKPCNFGGTVTAYGGGGGGGSFSPLSPGSPGGAGGGGRGSATGSPGVSVAGTVNTGGGGGGGGASVPAGTISLGSAGGSGIVVVRYLGSQKATGGTITNSGGYTIHTFTSGTATFTWTG